MYFWYVLMTSLHRFTLTGITGAAICYAVTPASKRGTLGNLALGNDVTQYQGFAVETTLTFLLLMTILAATDPSREDKTFGPALSIGLAVTACHLIGVNIHKDLLHLLQYSISSDPNKYDISSIANRHHPLFTLKTNTQLFFPSFIH